MNVKVFKVENLYIKNQCYLIHNDGIGVLIDPAWDYSLINDYIISNGINLKAVLLTHSHLDHVNLAQKFSEVYDIPVFMSEKEIEDSGFRAQNLNSVSHLGTIETIEYFTILPILTPGHTLGSTCYLVDNNLFTGDTVFIEGVGICNRDDAYKLYESVQFLKSNVSQDTLIWPGHSFGDSPGKDLQYLLKNNIYFQLENAEHFVDFRTRKNRPNPFMFK
ncbi:MBL fold metallo-hydrolase [Aquimarina sp. RZ0]|uniref:MBL fold metallo-hydrolase n=1 Tax=Aquimarina sp. RZ0 TaxID=2607730 RepID=UPI0011F1B495|nr:MBL fold metallo-hydrolase [Aquimarina sp. RZ0]KAA1244369.1 MBL fold metallo-hydrolase [Aquimarina sp. RZ0]